MAITDLSAAELSRCVRTRELSCRDVMAAFLERIDRVNPAVNAVVSLRDGAALMAEAAQADADLAGGIWRGTLHGLPMAPKDLVATAGLRTTWGSPIFADHVPVRDDLIAARMRAAGAIFIGKTNTPEWGHGSHSYNPVFGVTRNPYDLGLSAGGSSGGAAAALAARLLPVADGSDMMGSLRNPAAFCNVYGFRPTWGLVPGDAVADTFLSTMATEGPMARNIADLALLLDVIAGPNPAVPFCRAAEPFRAPAPLEARGVRIGWLVDWGGAYVSAPGILDICEAGLSVFEGLGATVSPLPPPFPAERIWQAWTTLRAMLNAGAKRATYDDPVRRRLLKPETIWEIEQGMGLSAAAVYEASVIRSRWYAKAAQLFERFDVLALPSAQVWPFPAEWHWPKEIAGRRMDTYHRWMEVVLPVSLAGLPCISLPLGFGPAGLPMGLQLFGPAGSDARLLALAESYHRATDWPGRAPPPV